MVKDVIYNIVGKQLGGNTLSQAEEDALNRWLQQQGSPEELELLKKTWRLSAEVGEELQPDVDREWERFKQLRNQKPLETPVRRLRIQKIAIAASVALLVSLGWLFFQQTQQATVYYAESAIQEVTLPDNSSVTLNKAGKLTVAKGFGRNHRTLTLEGEAFFKVSKDEIPFIINTASGIQTRVLGTEFHLKTSQKQVELNVVKGLVAFGPENIKEPLRVSKNQKAVANLENGTLIKNQLSTNSFSWLTHKLSFNNAPLREVHTSLEAYFEMPITFPSDTTGLHFSGNFNHPQAKELAEVLALSFNWSYSLKNGTLIFVSH